MGSKSRIAKEIVPIIQWYIDDTKASVYIEPFVGGANVIDKVKCKNKIGLDSNKYLIALLNHIKDDEKLLSAVNKELYSDVRNNVTTNKYEDWLVGNVGFLASYNGRWFDGGYAKSGYETTKTGKRFRDYYQESKSNILAQKCLLNDTKFVHMDYRDYDLSCLSGAVIYCDPPYQGTKQYSNSISFDHDYFWDVMRKWSENNIVIISEQNAPDDFECIWEKAVSRSIKANDKSISTEKLFIHK